MPSEIKLQITDNMFVCDECAIDQDRTPGLIRKEGSCEVCSGLGSMSKTTHIVPRRRAAGSEEVIPVTRRGASHEHGEAVAHCPHCEAEIDRLSYSAPSTEYGSCDLDGENFETDGNESGDGDIYYSCPECSEELSPSDVLWEANDEDESEDSDEATKE